MNIAIAGLGTVGAEVARQLINSQKSPNTRPHAKAEMTLNITAVSARTENRDRGFSMDSIAFEPDPTALAMRDDVDMVVELIGGDDAPALTLIEQALSIGKPVVTANKALLAKHGARLAMMAEEHGTHLAGEASVAGGIPVLKMLREGLAGNHISRISGILNGTCNYILSMMETTGRGFDDVLAEAQALGYAEADPSVDIDGIDAAHKLAILSAIGFGEVPNFDAIKISGIRNVSAVDIASAAHIGFAIRLLAIVERRGNTVSSSVQPTLVPLASSLAKVTGALNAVEVVGQPVGSVISIGPGAGAGATASAVLADIIDITAGRAPPFFGVPAGDLSPLSHTPSDTSDGASYYMRLTVYDRPGVLADVTAVLRDHQASVATMVQQGRSRDENGTVEIVLTTHEVDAATMTAAIKSIAKLDAVTADPTVMVIAASST